MYLERGITLALLIFLIFGVCTCIDTITLTQPLKDGDVLVSNGETFALGFFSPPNSTNRYVGIWYNKISEQTIVWVANRDLPITNSSGILSIDKTGNLVLQEKDHTFVYWSTNVSGVVNNSSAQLLDSGNLVLFQGLNKDMYSWQSFDYPPNTILPYMKIGVDRKTGLNRVFTSWKYSDDPGFGNYSHKIEVVGSPQLFLFQGMTKVWRTGSWTGSGWSGIPYMGVNFLYNFTFINNADEAVIIYQMYNLSIISRFVVTENKTLVSLTWNETTHNWDEGTTTPVGRCDEYNHCGAFGLCDLYNKVGTSECNCLPGYEPQSPFEWYLRDSSKGCKIKAGTQICKAGDGFIELTNIKVPDTSTARVNMSSGLQACKGLCLGDCTCMGYASADVTKEAEAGGCITWHGDMNDTRTFTDGAQSFYIRVDATELANYSSKRLKRSHKNLFLVIGTPMIAAGVLMAKQNEDEVGFSFTNSLKSLKGSLTEKIIGENVDLHVFDLSTLTTATDNFSHLNKLGVDGFGTVYKGKLLNGQEIAVKRLSQSSGQGMQEFKNEVTLIAKLQHKNLVRLVGYCFHKKEKMLVYEYLPNKGLDSFIFDWKKRFQIIQGIARGLLYLHHDSRLRIIHRDLKASNVLLDADLNPKISDFGMAKICGGNEDEAKTRRVVGTYGYMSPEYAMQGLFSVKSDVFSFGILVLEIISGRKNSSYSMESSINLIGHVWDLWKQEKPLLVVDSSLGDTVNEQEVLLCIHVGILCVQELAADRPTMTDIIFMLSKHETVLPSPNQPAFLFKKRRYSRDCEVVSINDDDITILHAR
ncbi:hypothetical protein M8C21_003060 [Ambrosia artemisiifolia]|uniref:Receptor-like serine/threonine-protein kinase n=1 Tax=Ambrosia artemisiifolia TaxID=4212 RepID=A0AAD5BWM9_AMBAR|nr:hypothetical protein M8C21_003060 [Ambrosia artemisiifolia]